MDRITIYTIGFTKSSAQTFFEKLRTNAIRLLIDVRLNNSSQLAGFTKGNDLAFFLKQICNASYTHIKDWAPTSELLDNYKKKKISWEEYENNFNNLLSLRRIEDKAKILSLDHSCLLCSEPTPQHCHRRLVAEYLQAIADNISIKHL